MEDFFPRRRKKPRKLYYVTKHPTKPDKDRPIEQIWRDAVEKVDKAPLDKNGDPVWVSSAPSSEEYTEWR